MTYALHKEGKPPKIIAERQARKVLRLALKVQRVVIA